jgi:hypothetical protein
VPVGESVGRIHVLDTGRLHPIEVGSRLWAIVAHPELNDDGDLAHVAEGIAALTIRESIKTDPENAPAWQEAYGRFLTIPEREAKRRTRTLHRRMRDRMVAARMSLGFFREGVSKESAPLPPSMKRLSLNELSRLVQPQTGQSEPENVEHRVWRMSRPVIHIAAAMQIAARMSFPDKAAGEYAIDNQELHRAIVEFSEFYERYVQSDDRFGIRPDQIVRVRLN